MNHLHARTPWCYHLICDFVHVDELQDGNIALEAMILSCFLISCTNDRPVKSSESLLRKGRNFIKIKFRNGEKWIYEVGGGGRETHRKTGETVGTKMLCS